MIFSIYFSKRTIFFINTNPPSFVWDSESGNLYVDIPER